MLVVPVSHKLVGPTMLVTYIFILFSKQLETFIEWISRHKHHYVTNCKGQHHQNELLLPTSSFSSMNMNHSCPSSFSKNMLHNCLHSLFTICSISMVKLLGLVFIAIYIVLVFCIWPDHRNIDSTLYIKRHFGLIVEMYHTWKWIITMSLKRLLIYGAIHKVTNNCSL